jgi:hypothetical protein
MQTDEDTKMKKMNFMHLLAHVKRKNRQPIQTTDRLQFVCVLRDAQGSFRVVVDTNRAEKLCFKIPPFIG